MSQRRFAPNLFLVVINLAKTNLLLIRKYNSFTGSSEKICYLSFV